MKKVCSNVNTIRFQQLTKHILSTSTITALIMLRLSAKTIAHHQFGAA